MTSVAAGGGKSSMDMHEKRKVTLDLFLAEEEVAKTFPRKGKQPLRIRVCSTGKDKKGDFKPVKWRMTQKGDTAYDYRVILRSQIVFDQGDHGDWTRTRRDAMLVWDALNALLPGTGGEYWGALSAGRGVHTELFIRPFTDAHGRDLRPYFAQNVIAWCNDRLPLDEQLTALLEGEDAGVESDPRLLAPKGDQLVREFGSRKNPEARFRKTIWTVGPGPYRILPETLDEAYAAAPLRFPERICPAVQPPGVFHALIAEAFEKNCPRSVECLTELDICQSCPAAF